MTGPRSRPGRKTTCASPFGRPGIAQDFGADRYTTGRQASCLIVSGILMSRGVTEYEWHNSCQYRTDARAWQALSRQLRNRAYQNDLRATEHDRSDGGRLGRPQSYSL